MCVRGCQPACAVRRAGELIHYFVFVWGLRLTAVRSQVQNIWLQFMNIKYTSWPFILFVLLLLHFMLQAINLFRHRTVIPHFKRSSSSRCPFPWHCMTSIGTLPMVTLSTLFILLCLCSIILFGTECSCVPLNAFILNPSSVLQALNPVKYRKL